MASNPNAEDGDPDVWEGLKGAAHLADVANRFIRGRDPRMRDKVNMAGDANVKDFLTAVGGRSGSEPARPHVDLRDTEEGVEVVVDTTGTGADAGNIQADVDGTEVKLREPTVGYEASISTDKPVVDAQKVVADSQVASLHLHFDGGNDHFTPASMEEAREAQQAGGGDEQSPAGDVPTLNEFLEENPYMEDTFRQMVGDQMFGMAVEMYGDKPMDELPLEEVMGGDSLEPDRSGGGGGSEESESADFTFDGGDDGGGGFTFGNLGDDGNDG